MNDSADKSESRGLSPRRFFIRKGLNLVLDGAPEQVIHPSAEIATVALLGEDYPGLRPSMLVREGDRVRLGQPLFVDRRNPDVPFTSPGTGVVADIHRGVRRALQSVVIKLDGEDENVFQAIDRGDIDRLAPDRIRELLLASGAWTALRTRPYGNVAAPSTSPQAVFVTAIDTRPLAPDPRVVIDQQRDAFTDGLRALARVTTAPTFLCVARADDIPTAAASRITVAEFRGPHPAGLVGTHMHLLAPVGAERPAWHIGYQDVIAIGNLLTSGRPCVERVVSLAGSAVTRPRLVRTRQGASVDELANGEIEGNSVRLLSGCPLVGRAASDPVAFLGRYHTQVTALRLPSATTLERHRGSRLRAFWRRSPPASAAIRPPLIPVDTFERVLPLDILPTPLFRALLAGDIDTAAALGCLELEEEDLALSGCVCPSRIDYGSLLRSTLSQLEAQA